MKKIVEGRIKKWANGICREEIKNYYSLSGTYSTLTHTERNQIDSQVKINQRNLSENIKIGVGRSKPLLLASTFIMISISLGRPCWAAGEMGKWVPSILMTIPENQVLLQGLLRAPASALDQNTMTLAMLLALAEGILESLT